MVESNYPEPEVLLDCIGRELDGQSVRALVLNFKLEQSEFDLGKAYLRHPGGAFDVVVSEEPWLRCTGVFWYTLLDGSFVDELPLPAPYRSLMSLSEARSELGAAAKYKPATAETALGYASERLIMDQDGLRHTVEFERNRLSLLFIGEFKEA